MLRETHTLSVVQNAQPQYCHQQELTNNNEETTIRGAKAMIKRTSKICGLLAALVLWSGMPANAQLTGQTEGGAFYTIAVPDPWNGDLVIWNHGYDFNPVGPNPDLGPLAPLQLFEGYAVAASSYQQNQWAVFTTREDLQELIEVFEDDVAKPNNIILTGASLGGIVTADALERADIDNVVGAYPFCGAMAGSRVWDGALDIRLTYDVICSGVVGPLIIPADIPGGATGLPEGSTFTTTDLALAANACFGMLIPPPLFPPIPRTVDQQARLDRFLAATKIPESFILTDLGFAAFGINNLIFDPRKLNGKQGLSNKKVEYDDPIVDDAIERVRTNRRAAKKLKRNFTPRGDLEEDDVKIVSIHTDLDGLVIVENEKEYQDVVDEDNLTVAIVAEGVPTHCGFTPAELVAGWESLRGWIAGAPQPSAAVIQVTCQAIEGGGMFSGPCRFDPTYVIADMDGRIEPRRKKKRKKRKKRKGGR